MTVYLTLKRDPISCICLFKQFSVICLTEFFIEAGSFKHALVHQCLFCWAVWDQFVSLGLKLTLHSTEKRNMSHFTMLVPVSVKWLFEN